MRQIFQRSLALAAVAVLLAGCGATVSGTARDAREWNVAGPLQAWDGAVWIVDATPIVVPADVGVDGQRVLGARVDAAGVFDAYGRRVARRVSVTAGALPDATLPAARVTGTIEGIAGELWRVGGRDVRVPAGTPITTDSGDDASALRKPGAVADARGYMLPSGAVLAVAVTLRARSTTSQPSTTPESSATPDPSTPPSAPEVSAPTPAAPQPPVDAPSQPTSPPSDPQPTEEPRPSATQPPEDGGDGGGHGEDRVKPKRPKKPKHDDGANVRGRAEDPVS